MVGSTLTSEHDAGGLLLEQPDGSAPWYAQLPMAGMGDVAQPPLEADHQFSLIDFFFPPVQELPGYYDPFSRQFAYGSAGVQP